METVQLTVTLTRSPEFGLGMEISGGTDCGGKDSGIYVNAVIPNGPAEGNLRTGDLLLGCNGNSLRRVTHDIAIAQLQRYSVVSLLVERKLDPKAALAVTGAPESGIQSAEDSNDHTGLLVEVTFAVRSFETQRSHLVVSKTLESINGVSVQQLTSPAHLSRLVDSAQSTTLRYKLTSALGQTSSGKSDASSTAGWSGNVDINTQQQQPSPPQMTRQKSEKEKLALATAAPKSPKLHKGAVLATSDGYQDSSNLFKTEVGRLPSNSESFLSGTGQAAQKLADRKVISAAGSPVTDMFKGKGVQPPFLSGQYGVKTGNQRVNGQGEFLFDRRGSDFLVSSERRAGSSGIRGEQQNSSLSLRSEKDDELSQTIEQTRTRRVGSVLNPLEAPPVGLTAAEKAKPEEGLVVSGKTASRGNDQSFIHRKIGKPVAPVSSGQQQAAQNAQEQSHSNGTVRHNSSAQQAEERKYETRTPVHGQEATTSSPKSQQRPDQETQVSARNVGDASPVELRHRKLDPGPANFMDDSRERKQCQSVNQQKKMEHRPVSLSEEKPKKPEQSPSLNNHHKNEHLQAKANLDYSAPDPPVKQKRKLAHQPLSHFEDDTKDQADDQLQKGKNVPSVAYRGNTVEIRMSERPGSQLDSQQSRQKMPTEQQGHRERIGSQKEETHQTSFIIGGYKFERPVTVSQTAREQTRLVLPDSSGSIGVKLDGGNAVGIFVQQVTPGAAADRAGIRPGDRLLAVDDKSLVGATKEEALLTLLRARGRALQVTLVSDSNDHQSFLASRQPGDRFYVRAHFSHTPPASSESAFKRNDVFLVRDTLAGNVIGSWEAVRVHPPPAETEGRLIPCANRADQIVMATAGSELPTAFPPYERVVQRRVTFCRPVVIFGPFADLIRDYLVKTLPDQFEQPEQDGQTVKLSDIRDVVSRGKHCVLDLNPVALDRLCFAQLAPIVLLVRAANRMVVKKVRKERGSKKLFLESQRIERWCHHLFTGVFTVDQPDLSPLLEGLDGLIHLQQGQLLWLAEKDERPVRALSEPNLCCSKPSSDNEKQLNFLGLDSLADDNADDKEVDDWRKEWRKFDEGHRSASNNSNTSGHGEDADDPFDAWQPLQQQRQQQQQRQVQLPLSQCSGIFDFSGGSLRCSRTGAELEIPAGALSVGRLVRLHLAVLGSCTLLLGPPGVRFLRPVIVRLPPSWRKATLVTANLSESGQATEWAELNWPDVSASRSGDDETAICMSGDRFEPVFNN